MPVLRKGRLVNTSTTVVCVLRSGGDFDAAWVRALRRGVRQYLLMPHQFVCLSDMDGVPGHAPLGADWPGWWAKLEALNPARWPTGERIVLMDLDTLPVGNLYRLATLDTEFAMLRALKPKRAAAGKRVSGIVVFRANEDTEAARLYRLFASDPERWMDAYRGDGEFLHGEGRGIDGIQDHVPGIVSYKWDCPDGCPDNACLALGHGQPRFSDPVAGWAHELWCERAGVRTEPGAWT